MYVTKLVEFGDEIALLLPDELLQKMGLRVGDMLKLEDSGAGGIFLAADTKSPTDDAGSA